MSGLKRLLLGLLLLGPGCEQGPRPKVMVLALDGCDPRLLRRLIGEGKLPHFARLQQMGGLWELQTTNPPQSPVAWATCLTGLDPGGHGIFDFLHRDPVTLSPVTSMSSVEKGQYRLQRRAPAFWSYLHQAGVSSTAVRVPCHFPAPSDGATALTGMGTPDLLGGYGTFTYYSEAPPREISGGTWVPVQAEGNRVRASLIGPQRSSAPLNLTLDRQAQQLLIETCGQRRLLKQGEWSDWVSVRLGSTPGILRFYVAGLQPLGLYASPLNADPRRPALPLCQPSTYAPHLARCCGLFYTQGMAEDTKALSAQILNDPAYLEQSRCVLEENRRLLKLALSEFQGGFFFFYLSHLDLQSHVFWATQSHNDVVEKAYVDVDLALGDVLERLDEGTTLWVVSDHGFAPFERVFDVNRWLVEQGWLKMEPGQPLRTATWGATRAYGVGFNGLYLNLQGRESQGTVAAQDKDRLLRELREKLLEVRDPQRGERVFVEVYRGSEIYSSTHRDRAPDLVLGYRSGYRGAWEAALGECSKEVFRDNRDHWNGDHLMDPSQVPGVLLCSRPIRKQDPSLLDVAPTVLKQFGVTPPPVMQGRNLLEE